MSNLVMSVAAVTSARAVALQAERLFRTSNLVMAVAAVSAATLARKAVLIVTAVEARVEHPSAAMENHLAHQ